MILIDDGTDWAVAKYIPEGKHADEFYDLVEEGWIDWAGPPDRAVADSEPGFASERFAQRMGKAGTLVVPAAGYAPWQKGRYKPSKVRCGKLYSIVVSLVREK